MIRAPIPGVRKVRASQSVANGQFIGFERLAAPNHRTHLELGFFYDRAIETARTDFLDPIKEVSLA